MPDYTQYLPEYDNQHSTAGSADAFDCVSEAITHAIEMMMAKRGIKMRYSPRALAKLSNTTPQGNSVAAVVGAVQKYGMIPYQAWPDLEEFTWDEYYAEIPQGVIDMGKSFPYNVYLTTPNFENDPVLLEIISAIIITPTGPRPSMTHFVVQFNDTQYFDSYMPDIKNIKPENVLSKFQLMMIDKNPGPNQPVDPNIYVISSGYTPQLWAAFTPEVQAAIKFNDIGGRNIIVDSKIVKRDPKFIYP